MVPGNGNTVRISDTSGGLILAAIKVRLEGVAQTVHNESKDVLDIQKMIEPRARRPLILKSMCLRRFVEMSD